MRPLPAHLTLGGTTAGSPGVVGRRSLLLGGAGLLGLTACGGSDSATRTVGSANGPVKVPESPKRVVAASPSAASYIWDVGVNPVGVYEMDDAELILPDQHVAKYRRTPKVKVHGELDVQPPKVAALRPDLIVGFDGMTGIEDTTYTALTKIAPTVMLRLDGRPDAAKQVADLLGRTAELNRLESRGRATSARIEATYGASVADRRFAHAKLDKDGKGTLEVFSGIKAILAQMPFSVGAVGASPSGTPRPGASAPLPKDLSRREVVDRLSDVDVIIHDPRSALPGTPFGQPGFERLKAVREGRLLLLRPAYLCTSQILRNLDLLERLLQKMRG